MQLSTSNPWAIYAGIVSGALLIYYIFVGWKYYRKEIRCLLGAKTKKQGSDSREVTNQIQEPDSNHEYQEPFEVLPPEWQDEELSAQVDNLFEHLTTEIEEAHQKSYDKQDLVQILQMILKDYQQLNRSAFRFAINKRIDAECAKFGYIHLSKDDKDQLWRMV